MKQEKKFAQDSQLLNSLYWKGKLNNPEIFLYKITFGPINEFTLWSKGDFSSQD